MGRHTKSKKSTSLPVSCTGKGKVTDLQVAFIVDRYLADAGFNESREHFRREASSLSKLPMEEVPGNLMTLHEMLNDYVELKAGRERVKQDSSRCGFEKQRIMNFIQSVEQAMNVYNSSVESALPLTTPSNPDPFVQAILSSDNLPRLLNTTVIGNSTPITATPITDPGTAPSSVITEQSMRKRTESEAKRRKLSSNRSSKVNTNQSPPVEQTQFRPSGVAKNLFNQPWLSSPAVVVNPSLPNSNSPNTPYQATTLAEQQSTPQNLGSATKPLQEVTPATYTVVTTERVVVSPAKNLAYYSLERNQCISSPEKTTMTRLCKRDCVKSRLDFDNTKAVEVPANPTADTSAPELEVEAPMDYDLGLDDFNFDEFLTDSNLFSDFQ